MEEQIFIIYIGAGWSMCWHLIQLTGNNVLKMQTSVVWLGFGNMVGQIRDYNNNESFFKQKSVGNALKHFTIDKNSDERSKETN